MAFKILLFLVKKKTPEKVRIINWLNVFQKWAAAIKVEQRLEEYEHQALDKTLYEEEFCPRYHKHNRVAACKIWD